MVGGKEVTCVYKRRGEGSFSLLGCSLFVLSYWLLVWVGRNEGSGVFKYQAQKIPHRGVKGTKGNRGEL